MNAIKSAQPFFPSRHGTDFLMNVDADFIASRAPVFVSLKLTVMFPFVD